MSEKNTIAQSGKDAAQNITKGALNVVSATGNIASSVADTSSKLVDTTGKTLVNVSSNLGNVASSGTQILSTTIGAIATTTERIENSTKAMAARRAEIEKSKTAAQQGKTAAEIAQIEADTKLKLQQIDNEYQISQKKKEDKLANELETLNTSQTQQLLKQQDNADKKSKSYYYGFTNNNPKPTDTGSVKARLYSKWCYSYIPEYFVTETGNIIEIVFPEKQWTYNSKRDSIINAKDKSNRDILIDFKTQKNTNFYGTTFLTVPVIQYSDDNSVNNGKMYYNKIWFVCDTYGGKKRLTKRRINKRRTNKKRSYKKINKKRTYKI
jgi:hypothetical protein